MLTVAGLHVPVIPLLDVVDKTGAVVPAQNGAIAEKDGEKMGFDKITPVNKLVEQPLISTLILE